jgi:hypothetical protein
MNPALKGNVRINPEVTRTIEVELAQERRSLEADRSLMMVAKLPEWARAKEIAEANIGRMEILLDDPVKLTADERLALLAEKRSIRWFLNLIDGAEERLPSYSSTIAKLETSLNERKAAQRTAD